MEMNILLKTHKHGKSFLLKCGGFDTFYPITSTKTKYILDPKWKHKNTDIKRNVPYLNH